LKGFQNYGSEVWNLETVTTFLSCRFLTADL
jgi:hypothetical protein